MEKLNLSFRFGKIADVSEMNSLTGKVDEIVDEINDLGKYTKRNIVMTEEEWESLNSNKYELDAFLSEHVGWFIDVIEGESYEEPTESNSKVEGDTLILVGEANGETFVFSTTSENDTYKIIV